MRDPPQKTQDQPQLPEGPSPELQFAMEQFRMEQNLGMGIVAGFIAAVVGATLWAVVTTFTGYQIGWMAVAIGFLVGYAVRKAGKGLEKVFGLTGAILSLFGCILGNILTITYLVASTEGQPFLEVLAKMDWETLVSLIAATFNYADLMFYALAIYFGYRLSFRQISQEELARAMGKGI